MFVKKIYEQQFCLNPILYRRIRDMLLTSFNNLEWITLLCPVGSQNWHAFYLTYLILPKLLLDSLQYYHLYHYKFDVYTFFVLWILIYMYIIICYIVHCVDFFKLVSHSFLKSVQECENNGFLVDFLSFCKGFYQ